MQAAGNSAVRYRGGQSRPATGRKQEGEGENKKQNLGEGFVDSYGFAAGEQRVTVHAKNCLQMSKCKFCGYKRREGVESTRFISIIFYSCGGTEIYRFRSKL